MLPVEIRVIDGAVERKFLSTSSKIKVIHNLKII